MGKQFGIGARRGRRWTLVVTAAVAVVASAPATAAHASGSSHARSATQKLRIAPVTRTGVPAAGWHVHNALSDGVISCSMDGTSYPSPAALVRNIYSCAPSAADADACWPAKNPHQALCLVDPWSHTLNRYTLDAPLQPVRAPKRPAPMRLLLANGDQCRIRDGGAWDAPKEHPSWIGYYWCRGTAGDIWAPASSPDGINRAKHRWTVWVGPYDGHLHKVAVTKAYFVTTKR